MMILTGVLIACGFFGVCWLVYDNIRLTRENELLALENANLRRLDGPPKA